jgi:hypothetical protein
LQQDIRSLNTTTFNSAPSRRATVSTSSTCGWSLRRPATRRWT